MNHYPNHPFCKSTITVRKCGKDEIKNNFYYFSIIIIIQRLFMLLQRLVNNISHDKIGRMILTISFDMEGSWLVISRETSNFYPPEELNGEMERIIFHEEGTCLFQSILYFFHSPH